MIKLRYKLKTLSSLIVSPRANKALYKELGQIPEKDCLKNDKIKVIYPFYQYGEYKKYDSENAEYYLPGSSIKGMLCQGSPAPADIMVDDISIEKNMVVLRNLHKAQHLNEQSACFDVFFENVGVEMIDADIVLKGEIYIRDLELAKTLFEGANQSTRKKLKQMVGYLQECMKKKHDQHITEIFPEAIDNMNFLIKEPDIFLLGGYKGLLHSLEFEGDAPNNKGAIFLDTEKKLPHGLVEVKLIKPEDKSCEF